jgi:hypothetical protein
MERLLSLELATLTAMGARMKATLGLASRAGPDALATWPAPIPALATRLNAHGVLAHALPIFGRWLWEELSADFDLLTAPSTRKFARMVKAALHASGLPTERTGAHSFRRGSTVGLFHGGASARIVSQALRHRNPRSTPSLRTRMSLRPRG